MKKNSAPAETTRKVARSAKSGEFTTPEFAKKHPSTTVVETVPVKKAAKKA